MVKVNEWGVTAEDSLPVGPPPQRPISPTTEKSWAKSIAQAIVLVGAMVGFVALIGVLAESRSWWAFAGFWFVIFTAFAAFYIKAFSRFPRFTGWPKPSAPPLLKREVVTDSCGCVFRDLDLPCPAEARKRCKVCGPKAEGRPEGPSVPDAVA